MRRMLLGVSFAILLAVVGCGRSSGSGGGYSTGNMSLLASGSTAQSNANDNTNAPAPSPSTPSRSSTPATTSTPSTTTPPPTVPPTSPVSTPSAPTATPAPTPSSTPLPPPPPPPPPAPAPSPTPAPVVYNAGGAPWSGTSTETTVAPGKPALGNGNLAAALQQDSAGNLTGTVTITDPSTGTAYPFPVTAGSLVDTAGNVTLNFGDGVNNFSSTGVMTTGPDTINGTYTVASGVFQGNGGTFSVTR